MNLIHAFSQVNREPLINLKSKPVTQSSSSNPSSSSPQGQTTVAPVSGVETTTGGLDCVYVLTPEDLQADADDDQPTGFQDGVEV